MNNPILSGTDTAAPERAAADTIRRLTCFDSLTGMPNRVLFREQLGLVLRIAKRQGWQLAVMIADIDDFRHIKHSLGHRGSDIFLRTIASRVSNSLRDSDVVGSGPTFDLARAVARISGNEFALLAHGLHGAHDAQRIAQRIRESVAAPVTVLGTEVFPTLSVGVALYPGDGDDAELLIERADIALGRAKELGKDRAQFFNVSMNSLAADRMELESSMRRGLALQEFFPVYQPRVNGRSGRFEGMEALVRWRHPERGVLAPGAFIPAAEQTRLIVPLGEMMLEAACRQNKAWQRQGLPPVPVSVNISPLQVSRPDFVATVARALERSGLEPRYLELEITESVLMNDAAAAQRAFSMIKAMGVLIAIDDFGTGFSSLAYLRDFPLDVLKIDRAFVNGLPDEARTGAITGAIIDLARRLQLDVVAEGVETESQRRYLCDNGCNLMQGYLFARPLEPAALEAMWMQAAHRGGGPLPGCSLAETPAAATGGLALAG